MSTELTNEQAEELAGMGWKPVTAAGQVNVGDSIRFTIGDRNYSEMVCSVLSKRTDKEEVIYNRGRNFYFITSMVLDGTSSHKRVEVFAKVAAPTPPSAPVQQSVIQVLEMAAKDVMEVYANPSPDEYGTLCDARDAVLRVSEALSTSPLLDKNDQAEGEETYSAFASNDREMLLYLMQAFDSESWQCERCGHAEDTATMDSAGILRDYLSAHPQPPQPDSNELVELRRDAERYRAVREGINNGPEWIRIVGSMAGSGTIGLRHEYADQFIDRCVSAVKTMEGHK